MKRLFITIILSVNLVACSDNNQTAEIIDDDTLLQSAIDRWGLTDREQEGFHVCYQVSKDRPFLAESKARKVETCACLMRFQASKYSITKIKENFQAVQYYKIFLEDPRIRRAQAIEANTKYGYNLENTTEAHQLSLRGILQCP